MKHLFVIVALLGTCCAEVPADGRAPATCYAQPGVHAVRLTSGGSACDEPADLNLDGAVEIPMNQECGTMVWELEQSAGICTWRVLVSAYVDDVGVEDGSWYVVIRLVCPPGYEPSPPERCLSELSFRTEEVREFTSVTD